MDKGLDMRLDHVDAAWQAELEKGIEGVARGKLREFEEERREGE